MYGFDGGKKVKGRLRHIVVDSQGLLLGLLVTEANAPERLCAVAIFQSAGKELSKVVVLWVDCGYSGENAKAMQQMCGVKVEVIERNSKKFEVLPKRWIVERTFGWLSRFRRSRQRIMSFTQNTAKPWFMSQWFV